MLLPTKNTCVDDYRISRTAYHVRMARYTPTYRLRDKLYTLFWRWRSRQTHMVFLRHLFILLLAVYSLDGATSAVRAAVSLEVERGYTVLMQAHSTTDGAQYEQLLTAAVKIFKNAYQGAGRDTQLHALLGAAQSYMAMQHPRRVFPFLWQATPLQRAEKILQQAFVLHAENAAAALLMGLVTWRQAASLATGQEALLQRSKTYLEQTRALGVPVYTAPATPSPVPGMDVRDTLVLVRFLEARRTGHLDDLLIVFRTSTRPEVCFAIIVSDKHAYALSSVAATGAFIPAAALETLSVVESAQAPWPWIVARFRQPHGSGESRFTWDGSRFVHVP